MALDHHLKSQSLSESSAVSSDIAATRMASPAHHAPCGGYDHVAMHGEALTLGGSPRLRYAEFIGPVGAIDCDSTEEQPRCVHQAAVCTPQASAPVMHSSSADQAAGSSQARELITPSTEAAGSLSTKAAAAAGVAAGVAAAVTGVVAAAGAGHTSGKGRCLVTARDVMRGELLLAVKVRAASMSNTGRHRS